MKVLVTGANGFIGSALVRRLALSGVSVCGSVRSASQQQAIERVAPNVTTYLTGAIGRDTEWGSALAGVDAIVHTAGRAHVLRERCANPLLAFRTVNVEGTERLAREAVRYGVRRFVYLSSVGVHGDHTKTGERFQETDTPNPVNDYSRSKLEAEEAIQRVTSQSSLEAVIVRPTLVYGPAAPGNMAAMLTWLHRGIPLPLANVSNARSLVSLENLCSLLSVCLTHPQAAGETFLAADVRAVSTPEMLRLIACGMGRTARLFPLSERLLRLASAYSATRAIYQRLCGSLVVDIRKAADLLDWRPPLAIEQGLIDLGHCYSESGFVGKGRLIAGV